MAGKLTLDGKQATIARQKKMLNSPKNRLIDRHSHLLPGVDDGAPDAVEALKMAAVLAELGFTDVYCTPHLIQGHHDGDGGKVVTAVKRLQCLLDLKGINLRLHAGREYCLDEYMMGFVADSAPVFGGKTVLVEIPRQTPSEMVKASVYRLRNSGYIPMIAHPERYYSLLPPLKNGQGLMGWIRNLALWPASATSYGHRRRGGNPGLVEYMKSVDCLFQGNIGSFAGLYGEEVRRRAVRFLEAGLYDCLGSDAHASLRLRGWLERGMRKIEGIVGNEGLQQLLSGCPVDEKPIAMESEDKVCLCGC